MTTSNKKSNSARTLVARKLRYLRFQRGWSQEDLAAASGLHRTYISAVERGATNISLDNIEKLADAFGLEVYVLFEESPPALPLNAPKPPRIEEPAAPLYWH